MRLSHFFIDRPIFAGVLSLLIFLGGLIAVRGLPISEYPEVVPPSIVVRANYPGANPKVIAANPERRSPISRTTPATSESPRQTLSRNRCPASSAARSTRVLRATRSGPARSRSARRA